MQHYFSSTSTKQTTIVILISVSPIYLLLSQNLLPDELGLLHIRVEITLGKYQEYILNLEKNWKVACTVSWRIRN